MSDAEDNQQQDKSEQETTKPARAAEPSIPAKVYDDVSAEASLRDLQQLVSGQVSEQEVAYLAEIGDYLADKSGSWSVGDEHLTLIASFLANKDNRYAPNVPLLSLQILRCKLFDFR